MRCSGFLHPVIRLCPCSSAVITPAYAASITCNSLPSPHLWSRQVMRPTVHAPSSPFHLGVKYNPVRCVHPFFRHATCRTNPGVPAIFAAEKADIRCGNKLSIVIKRIKVVAIGIRYIKARGDPSVFAGFS